MYRFAATALIACLALLFGAIIYSFARGEERGQAPDAYAVAYAQAVRLDKPLVVRFSMPGCPPCRECEWLYARDLERYAVCVPLDIERDRAVIERYHLTPPGRYPSLLIYERYHGKWVAPRIEIGLPRIGIYIGEIRRRVW